MDKAKNNNEKIKELEEKHPRFFSFLKRRLDPETEFGLYLTIGTVLSLALLVVFFELMGNVVYKDPTVRVDIWVLNIVELFRSSGLDHVMLFFTFFGRGQSILLGIFFVSVILFLHDRKRYLFTLLFSVAVGQIIVMVLKTIVSRPRPQILNPLTTENSFSFPSGHAFVVFSFFGLVAYFIYKNLKKAWQRTFIIVVAILVVMLVSSSRIYLGVHWPSDVLASFAAGGAWLTVMITSLEIKEKRRKDVSYPYVSERIISLLTILFFVIWLAFIFWTSHSIEVL